MGACLSSSALTAQVHPLRSPPPLQALGPPRVRAALDPAVEALLLPAGGVVVSKPSEVTVVDSATLAYTHTQAAHRRVVMDELVEGEGESVQSAGSPLAALPLSPAQLAAAQQSPLPLGSGGGDCLEPCATSLPTVHHTEHASQPSPLTTGTGTAALPTATPTASAAQHTPEGRLSPAAPAAEAGRGS